MRPRNERVVTQLHTLKLLEAGWFDSHFVYVTTGVWTVDDAQSRLEDV